MTRTQGEPITIAQRRRIVDLHRRGYTIGDIATAMACDHCTVRRWIARYQAEGEPGLESRPPHNALPSWVRPRIVRLKTEHPELSAYRIAKILTPEIYPDNGTHLSDQTVRDILEEEYEP